MSESIRRRATNYSIVKSALLGTLLSLILVMLAALPVYQGVIGGRSGEVMACLCPALGGFAAALLTKGENGLLRRALLLTLSMLVLYIPPLLLVSRGEVSKAALPKLCAECGMGALAGSAIPKSGKKSKGRKNGNRYTRKP